MKKKQKTIAKSQTEAEIAHKKDAEDFVVDSLPDKCHHCGKTFTLKRNLITLNRFMRKCLIASAFAENHSSLREI